GSKPYSPHSFSELFEIEYRVFSLTHRPEPTKEEIVGSIPAAPQSARKPTNPLSRARHQGLGLGGLRVEREGDRRTLARTAGTPAAESTISRLLDKSDYSQFVFFH